MKKRLLASLLSLAMVLTLLPTAALAVEDEPDTGDPPQECICETLCTKEAVNTESPVCAEDISACTGTALEEDPAESVCAELPGGVGDVHDAECPLYVADDGESEGTDEGEPTTGNPETTDTDEPQSDENTETSLPQEPSVVEPTPASPETAGDETKAMSGNCGGDESAQQTSTITGKTWEYGEQKDFSINIYDNAKWALTSNGDGSTYTLTISGKGAMADYLSGAVRPWNDYASSITKLIVEDGITSVGSRTCYNCSALTTFQLPASVTDIGEYSFSSTALTAIDLSNVTSIRANALRGNKELVSVTLSENLTKVDRQVFRDSGAENATIEIPASVTEIGYGAFNGSNFTNVLILPNVTKVGAAAFSGSKFEAVVMLNPELEVIPGKIDESGQEQANGVFSNIKAVFFASSDTVLNSLYDSNRKNNIGVIACTEGGIFAEDTVFKEFTLPTPIKDGYKFDGWYSNKEYSEEGKLEPVEGVYTGVPTTDIQKDGRRYYAKWEEIDDKEEGGYDIAEGQETVKLEMDSGESVVSATVSVVTPSDGSIAKVEVSDSNVLSAKVGEDGKTVIITPKSNLAAGTYTETVYVYAADGDDGAPGSTHWITVTLDVNEAPVTPPDDRPSSGGSSSSSTRYTVSVEATDNGSVRVSPTRAERGDTVTITVDPDNGYELDELVVTDSDGDEISVRDRGNGKYTFTMPRSRVTVEATFAEIVEEPEALPFVDVPTGAYYYDAVAWAVENGVTNGTSATTFGPDVTCTRAQMVTFLWRAAGSPEPETTENPFTDLSASAYYYDAVLWAVNQGITSGTSATTFSPDATVTRGQTVTFLWRNAGSPAASGNNFADVAADAYYVSAVAWAADEGITSGTSATTFSPDNACTRAQIVTFLWRYLV